MPVMRSGRASTEGHAGVGGFQSMAGHTVELGTCHDIKSQQGGVRAHLVNDTIILVILIRRRTAGPLPHASSSGSPRTYLTYSSYP